MFGKNFLTILLATVIFLTGSLMVSAQVAGASGKVLLAAADGSTKPAPAGLSIETFRVDINQKGPTAKTDSKGEFRFAGLPLGGKFIISVSGTGISPMVYPNFAAGVDSAVITVYPGDGKKYTEAEARDALKNPPPTNTVKGTTGSTTAAPQTSAEQKKQQEEYNKKLTETKAANEKIQNADAIAAASFKEGREALIAKNYDLAISKSDAGLAAVPDFVGSSPALLNVKAGALRGRAVDTFNANNKSTDITTKLQAMEAVKKDLGSSADLYNQAYNIIKNAPAGDLSANPNAVNFSKDALVGAKETFRLMAATKQVDADKITVAKTLLPEYMKTEADAAEKTKAQNILGDLYLNANDYENAIVEYRKVIEVSPDNVDALGNLGFSLVSQGYITFQEGKDKKDNAMVESGKSKLQEAANYLQKFIAAAPDSNILKQDAKDAINNLKVDQNVTPQKITVTKRKG